MTEAQWATGSPLNLYDWIEPRTTPRKLQLLAVAACRLLPGPPYQLLVDGIDTLERYAEGMCDETEYLRLRDQIDEAEKRDRQERESVTLRGERPWEFYQAVRFTIWLNPRYAISWILDAVSRAALPGEKQNSAAATRRQIREILHELFGNPFRPFTAVPSWQGGGLVQPDGRTVMFTESVKGLAEAVHATGDFGRMPILADALEEAGVTDPVLLAHCRAGEHLRGCWALDLVRGRS